MGTTTVPVPKCVWVYKDINGTFICWSGTDPDAQVNYFSWVFITSESFYPPVCPSVYPSVCISISWSIDWLINQSVGRSVCLSIHLSVGGLSDWSVDPSVHLSVS